MEQDESRSKTMRHLWFAFLALAVVMFIGTVGYRILGEEKYSWLDCFYMTFITFTTIGYNETVDVTGYEYGRLFTIFIGITGIGVLGYVLSTVTAFMLESDLNTSWRRKKMRERISHLRGHYIVCGMGQIGSNVARELAQTGRPFVMVDMNKANLQSYVEQHPAQLHVLGDATDNEVLQAAGIMHARGVFAVAHDDNQNLVISLSAKQLNPQTRVIARCHDPKNVAKIRSAGADEIVLLDFTGGLRMVSVMVRPHVVGFLDEMIKAEGDLRVEEVVIPERMNGRTMSALQQGDRECLVIALRQQGSWRFNPAADCILHAGDVLMAMVTPNGRANLEHLLQRA